MPFAKYRIRLGVVAMIISIATTACPDSSRSKKKGGGGGKNAACQPYNLPGVKLQAWAHPDGTDHCYGVVREPGGVDWNAADDDAWYEAVQNDFGLDARR